MVANQYRDLAEKLKIDRESMVLGILLAIAAAKASEDPSAAIRGWREINRMMGFYEPEAIQLELNSNL